MTCSGCGGPQHVDVAEASRRGMALLGLPLEDQRAQLDEVDRCTRDVALYCGVTWSVLRLELLRSMVFEQAPGG